MKWIKVVVALVILLGLINYFRPLPKLQPIYDLSAPALTTPQALVWPSRGQAAIGAIGYGILDAMPTDQAAPIASIAKIVTALTVLKQKPLVTGQTGPTLTMTERDVSSYQSYLSKNGSVVGVAAGEQLSEYQALEAMLLPSGNNMADSLAIWAFGSIKAYVEQANALIASLGMKHTQITSASGFSADTVSTARDLILLGQAALANPVLAEIVAKPSETLPVAGLTQNTNRLLGINGVNGIKTGNTAQAGGCYLFSSRQTISGQVVSFIGVILGAETTTKAMDSGLGLITSAKNDFEYRLVASQDQLVAHYQTAWGKKIDIVSAADLKVLNWRGQAIQITIEIPEIIYGTHAGSKVGQLKATAGGKTTSVDLKLSDNLSGPSWYWRLLRL